MTMTLAKKLRYCIIKLIIFNKPSMSKKLALLASGLSLLILIGAGCQQPAEEQNTDVASAPEVTALANADIFDLKVESPEPGMVSINWVAPADANAESFYRLVYGPNENPAFPGSRWFQRTDKTLRNAAIAELKPQTYHFRICEFNGTECVRYSSDVAVEVK